MGHREESEWLTLGQAARFLGVAQSTIRKWSDQGRVPAFYTPGGHRRYRRADLESFLDRSGPGGRPKAGPLVLLVDDDDKVRELVDRVRLAHTPSQLVEDDFELLEQPLVSARIGALRLETAGTLLPLVADERRRV